MQTENTISLRHCITALLPLYEVAVGKVAIAQTADKQWQGEFIDFMLEVLQTLSIDFPIDNIAREIAVVVIAEKMQNKIL